MVLRCKRVKKSILVELSNLIFLGLYTCMLWFQNKLKMAFAFTSHWNNGKGIFMILQQIWIISSNLVRKFYWYGFYFFLLDYASFSEYNSIKYMQWDLLKYVYANLLCFCLCHLQISKTVFSFHTLLRKLFKFFQITYSHVPFSFQQKY